MEIKYKYGIKERVQTIFKEIGIIEMAASDERGIQYFVKTKNGTDWYAENELIPIPKDMAEIYNLKDVYLTEEKKRQRKSYGKF